MGLTEASIRDRIRKLLRLAGRNPNAHEAWAALAKAQALMAAHRLTEADLAADDETSAALPSGASRILARVPWPDWQEACAVALAEAYGGRAIRVTTPTGDRLVIWGPPPVVDTVAEVWAWIIPVMDRLATRWQARHPGHPLDSYYLGFIVGFREVLHRQREAHPEWGLVVSPPPRPVPAAPSRPSGTGLNPAADPRGFLEGVRDGRSVARRDTLDK